MPNSKLIIAERSSMIRRSSASFAGFKALDWDSPALLPTTPGNGVIGSKNIDAHEA